MQEEERRARHLRQVEEKAFFKRAAPGTPGALNCALLLELPHGWREAALHGKIPVRIFLETHGTKHPIGEIARDTVLGLTAKDEAVLFVLEEIAGGAVPDELPVGMGDFIQSAFLAEGADRSGKKAAANWR